MNTDALLNLVREVGGSVRLVGNKVIANRIPASLLPEVRAHKDRIKAHLISAANDASEMMSCKTCLHRTPMKSCGDPVHAGLSEQFEICWHPEDGRGCEAWTPYPPPTADEVIWIDGEYYIARPIPPRNRPNSADCHVADSSMSMDEFSSKNVPSDG